MLVTGAAGGIGAAVAHRLVRQGARPILLDLPGRRLDALARDLAPLAVAAPADVTDRAAVVAAIDAAAGETEGIAGAVIGAGVVRPDTLAEQSERDARTVIDVNVYGTLWAVQAVLPHIDRAGGHLLALSSVSGIAPIPLSGVYPATKAAVGAIVATVRTEAMNRDMTAGVVYLSAVDTQMNTDVLHDARAARAAHSSLAFLTRPLSPEHVARDIVRGLERRRRAVVAPAWMSPAAWPQSMVLAAAEWVMGRTGLRNELPGRSESATGTSPSNRRSEPRS